MRRTLPRRWRWTGASIASAVVLAAPAVAHAQSLNVDFAQGGPVPSSSYAAAGLPGVWNSVAGQSGTTYNLVGLDGSPTNVTLTQTGATSFVNANDPSVTGDDAALMNSALLTDVAGQEVCILVNGLEPGTYEVLMYTWMPNAPTVMSRARQDLASATQDVGGAWPGSQVQGVTYARFTLDFTGYMGSHSGIVPGASPANGAAYNGFQLIKMPNGSDGGVDAAAPDSGSGRDAGGGGSDGGRDASGGPSDSGSRTDGAVTPGPDGSSGVDTGAAGSPEGSPGPNPNPEAGGGSGDNGSSGGCNVASLGGGKTSRGWLLSGLLVAGLCWRRRRRGGSA